MSMGWTAPGSTESADLPGSGASEGMPHGAAPGPSGGGPHRELVQEIPLFPLRPLGLGEVLGAAVRIYRLRAKTVLGLAAAVYGVAFVLITLLTGAGMIPFIGEMQAVMEDPTASTTGATTAPDAVLMVGSSVVTMIITMFAASLVTVALTTVSLGEATGEPVSGAQMWATVRHLVVPAILVSILIGALSLLAFTVPAVLGALPVILLQEANVFTIGAVIVGLVVGVLATIWIWSRTVLALPALVVEDAGIIGSVRRAFAMTRGRRLWRVLGTSLLIYLIYSFAAQVVAGVFGFLAMVAYLIILLASSMEAIVLGVAVLTIISMIGSYLATVLLAPFLSAGFVGVYADNRMRHEAWDVELTRRARENWNAGGVR